MNIENLLNDARVLRDDLASKLNDIQNSASQDIDVFKKYNKKILSVSPPGMLSEITVRKMLQNNLILENLVSFKLLVSLRIARNQVCGFNTHLLNIHSKEVGRNLALQLGYRVPKIVSEPKTIDDIQLRENTVLKPVGDAGARGVYYIFKKNNIVPVKKGKKIKSFDELKYKIIKDIELGVIKNSFFILEEIIYEDLEQLTPGRDLKFFMFYGKIGMVLETVRKPKLQRCWFDASSRKIETGKYLDKDFAGLGFDEKLGLKVCELSKKIPAPFMRIDLIKSHDGELLLGEFSPKPAGYDLYSEKYDKYLGELYLDAEARLLKDMLRNSGCFSDYLQYADNS